VLQCAPSCGAVAQLGERRVRNAKVEGSIPFRSTNSFCWSRVWSRVERDTYRAATGEPFSEPVAESDEHLVLQRAVTFALGEIEFEKAHAAEQDQAFGQTHFGAGAEIDDVVG
jgi:hypothetical protein